MPPNWAHPVRHLLDMLTPCSRGALFATPVKENISMAEADRRPARTFAIAMNLVSFIFGVALTIVVLLAGIVTPPI